MEKEITTLLKEREDAEEVLIKEIEYLGDMVDKLKEENKILVEKEKILLEKNQLLEKKVANSLCHVTYETAVKAQNPMEVLLSMTGYIKKEQEDLKTQVLQHITEPGLGWESWFKDYADQYIQPLVHKAITDHVEELVIHNEFSKAMDRQISFKADLVPDSL